LAFNPPSGFLPSLRCHAADSSRNSLNRFILYYLLKETTLEHLEG
jgi:hypothetical protein